MRIVEYKINFINSLLPFYDEMEAEIFFYLILENRYQLRRIDLALDAEKEFSEAEISNWNFILEKLNFEIYLILYFEWQSSNGNFLKFLHKF